jgi:hypothetical protein
MNNKNYVLVKQSVIDTLKEYAEELEHEPGIHTQGISNGITYALNKIMEQKENIQVLPESFFNKK